MDIKIYLALITTPNKTNKVIALIYPPETSIETIKTSYEKEFVDLKMMSIEEVIPNDSQKEMFEGFNRLFKTINEPDRLILLNMIITLVGKSVVIGAIYATNSLTFKTKTNQLTLF